MPLKFFIINPNRHDVGHKKLHFPKLNSSVIMRTVENKQQASHRNIPHLSHMMWKTESHDQRIKKKKHFTAHLWAYVSEAEGESPLGLIVEGFERSNKEPYPQNSQDLRGSKPQPLCLLSSKYMFPAQM